MWTVFICLNLGLLHCTVSSSLPSPINVAFSSVNLRNVLEWSPGNGTPEGTHFKVQYAIYGDSVQGSKGRQVHWRPVHQCTKTMRSWCDLSNETWDEEQGYYARVRAVGRGASSKWVLTVRRFDPKLDTTLGPPLVSVEIEDNNAIITLRGPVRYQSNNHTPVVSMATFYPQMTYNLSIHNANRGQTHHFQVVSSPYTYRLVEHKTEYCFSAKARFLSMPIKCQSSAQHCITTPPDPVTGQLQRVIWGIVVPSLCMCVLMVVGYFLHNYLVGKGQKRPNILNPPTFHLPPLMFPPENPRVILFTVIGQDELASDTDSGISDPACPKRPQHIADPPPRYHNQRPETPSEPEESWDDLSIDYGQVVVAPEMNERGERRHDRGEVGNDLNGERQKCVAGDSCEETERRDEDGLSAGVYSPQVKSCFQQESSHTWAQTHMPMHSQTEMSTLVQAQAWSQLKSILLTQIQGLPFQGATKGEADREKEDRECPGVFLNRKPQTGLFHIPLNLQINKEVGRGEEKEGKVRVRADGKTDGGVEERSESEQVALLSAYASQNIRYMPTSHADQSDFLPNNYGVLSLARARSVEEDNGEDEEEDEEGTTRINWDPETRKLVLPVEQLSMEGGLDELIQGEERGENRMGGEEEEEEAYAVKGGLKLENVFVRQASEEEAEARRKTERGGDNGWEADDILTKWNLVISMDE